MYDLILLFLALAALPHFLFQVIWKKKYRHSFFKRMGCGFLKKADRLVWMHAVSVGEVKAASTLIPYLQREHYQVLLTCVTETGFKEAHQTPADFIHFMPFDFSWVIKPLVKRLRPKIVILVETDFWPNFLRASKKLGAKIFLVNGKLSERSFKRFRLFGLSSFFFSPFDYFCVQDALYRDRFSQLGIKNISICPSLKYSVLPKTDPEETIREKLSLTSQDFVLTLGSTHAPEEELLLEALKPLFDTIPLKLLLVPRHPERFNEVAALLEKMGFSYSRYSEVKKTQILLIDTMGQLLNCYKVSDIALVAGTYTQKIGGHNLLEPAYFATPILYGPYIHSQRAFDELLQKEKGALQVSLEELPKVLLSFYKDPQERIQQGERGALALRSLSQSAQKTFDILKQHLS